MGSDTFKKKTIIDYDCPPIAQLRQSIGLGVLEGR